MGLFVLIKLGAVTIVTKGFALLSICVPIHPPPSLPAFFSSGWNRTSLLLRLLPLFLLVPFLLPLVWRSRQSALIRDCAAQPSASRGCWESMARLQDPCALAGDKWKHNRESWGGGGLCHSCSGSHWLSVSLTPSHCWREKERRMGMAGGLSQLWLQMWVRRPRWHPGFPHTAASTPCRFALAARA